VFNVFDSNLQSNYEDTTASCNFGIKFRQNYIGAVSMVMFYMNFFVRTDVIGLTFQGSNDNIAYTTIFTVGEEVHEGWNYYELPSV